MPSKADGLQEVHERGQTLCKGFPGEERLMEKNGCLVFRELLWASLALGGSSEKAARNESRGNGASD